MLHNKFGIAWLRNNLQERFYTVLDKELNFLFEIFNDASLADQRIKTKCIVFWDTLYNSTQPSIIQLNIAEYITANPAQNNAEKWNTLKHRKTQQSIMQYNKAQHHTYNKAQHI